MGHVVIGKRYKGLFFLLAILLIYLAGLSITGFRAISLEDNWFYYLGNIGCGGIWLVNSMLGDEKPRPPEGLVSWLDPGLLYICVAGLLNLVVVLNILETRGNHQDQ
jgi:hypothetical protein